MPDDIDRVLKLIMKADAERLEGECLAALSLQRPDMVGRLHVVEDWGLDDDGLAMTLSVASLLDSGLEYLAATDD